MDFSPFFDYPGADSQPSVDELIFLPNWTARDWDKLFEYTQVRPFNEGEIVITAGDVDRALHLVSFGTLEVLIPRRTGGGFVRFTTVEAGSVLGEQTFLDGKPRSAMIRAVVDSQTSYLGLEAFEIFAAREPELARELLFDLGRILSIRLRQTTAFISDWTK